MIMKIKLKLNGVQDLEINGDGILISEVHSIKVFGRLLIFMVNLVSLLKK